MMRALTTIAEFLTLVAVVFGSYAAVTTLFAATGGLIQ